MPRADRAIAEREVACLTIIESASPLSLHELNPGVLDDLRADRHAAVVQQADEPSWMFAARVARRVRSLVSGGSCVRQAVVVTNGLDDAPATAARWWMTRALLPALKLSRGGRLILRAPDTLSADARHSLLALAGTVATEVGAFVEISVLFGSESLRPPHSAVDNTLEEPLSGVA